MGQSTLPCERHISSVEVRFQPAGQKLLVYENVKLSLEQAKFGLKDFTPNSQLLEPGVVAPKSPLLQLAYAVR